MQTLLTILITIYFTLNISIILLLAVIDKLTIKRFFVYLFLGLILLFADV